MKYDLVYRKEKWYLDKKLILIFAIILIIIEFCFQNIIGLNYLSSFIFLILNLVFIGIIGEFLLDSATKISVKLAIPMFIIGLILIPMFSSLPEDAITIITNIRESGLGEIVIAQILGNNLFELLVIFGISGILMCKISKKCISVGGQNKILFLRNGLILFFGSILVFLLVFFDRNLSFSDGLILLMFYAIFILIIYFSYKFGIKEMDKLPEEVPQKEEIKGFKEFTFLLIYIIIVLFYGSFFVDEVLFLAKTFPNFEKFNFLIIGIAIATPELVITIIGFLREKVDIGIGLVLGGALWDSIISISIQGIVNPVYNISSLILIFFLIVSIVGIGMAVIYIRTQWILKTWEAIILILTYIIIVIIVLFIV